jgi:hypothetical protein
VKARDDITPEELLSSLLSSGGEKTAYELAEQRKQHRLRLVAAERAARLARESLQKLEHEAALAREAGDVLPEAFWAAFGSAYVSVRLAERDLAKAREVKP